MEKFKFFISFGGLLSDNVAQHLKSLLKTLQAVEGWISSQDLPKGKQWLAELLKRLGQQQDLAFAVVVVTRESLDSEWMMMESTALATKLGFERVFPVLVDVEADQLRQPLSLFHATNLRQEDDVLRLLLEVNDLTDRFVDPDHLEQKLFRPAYEEWDRKLRAIVASHPPPPTVPTMATVMSELQELKCMVGSMGQQLSRERSDAGADWVPESRVTVPKPLNLPRNNNLGAKRSTRPASSPQDFYDVMAAAASAKRRKR